MFETITITGARSRMLTLDALSSPVDLNGGVKPHHRAALGGKLGFDEPGPKSDRHPPIGPDPILVSRKELDELYDLLDVLIVALQKLKIRYVVTAGSLLGAVRSESFLFNDVDVDIAIVEDGTSYERLKKGLPELLNAAAKDRNKNDRDPIQYTYQERPLEGLGADRVTSSAAPRVWIDVFTIREYQSSEDLTRVISKRENGQDQSEAYVEQIHSFMPDATYPLYHYDNRRAIELWPKDYLTPEELFPTVTLTFGHLKVQGPKETIPVVRRMYGPDCFTHYTIKHYESARRPSSSSCTSKSAARLLLKDDQYLPVQHSNPDKRIWSSHCRQELEAKLASALKEDDRPVSPPTTSPSGLSRTKTRFSLDKPEESLSVAPQAPRHAALEPQTSQWFGVDVRAHIGESPEAPVFDRGLRAVMESHLRKARLGREQARDTSNLIVDASIAGSVGVPYTSLRKERPFLFDEYSYPLHTILAETLGVDDLSKLHESPIQDKAELLEPLLRSSNRRRFHECYDSFVTSFCIPLLHSIAMTKNLFHSASPNASNKIHYRYQAFPCIRIVRPGESSNGPHCDTANGHSIGYLTFHVPLTAVFGTNALYTESYPGREDWHPLTTKSVGLGYMFDGARCLHFTLENTTPITRVAIDFRIAIYRKDQTRDEFNSDLCTRAMLEDRFSRAGPGYYDEACIDIDALHGSFGGGAVAKKDFPDDLYEPDYRVGFPFTTS